MPLSFFPRLICIDNNNDNDGNNDGMAEIGEIEQKHSLREVWIFCFIDIALKTTFSATGWLDRSFVHYLAFCNNEN